MKLPEVEKFPGRTAPTETSTIDATMGPPYESPTGAQVCRLFQVKNEGPRMPTTGLRARDYDANEMAKTCPHETTSHGGNSKAFWVQCSRCRLHLEYYPRRDTQQMVEVDQYMLAWEEKLRQEKSEAKIERERIKQEKLQLKNLIKT